MAGPDRTPFDKLRAPQETLGAPQETLGAPQETLGAPQETLGAPQETLGAPDAGRAAVWVDDAPIDPTWADPQDPDTSATGRGRRRLLIIGIPVLVLIVLVGTVFAAGGFKERDDDLTDIKLGQSFTNGGYVFSFSSATIQQAPGLGKNQHIQRVVVTGTIRNISDTAAPPLDDWFLARGVHSTQTKTPQGSSIGDPDQLFRPEDVTPGLPAVPLNVPFEFPGTFSDTDLLFGVRQLTFGDHSYFSGGGDSDQTWDASGSHIFRLRLGLKRLAPAKY